MWRWSVKRLYDEGPYDRKMTLITHHIGMYSFRSDEYNTE